MANITFYNASIRSLEAGLFSTGSSWARESCILFILLPCGCAGFVLNCICAVVFMNKNFQLPLYKYLRVYIANSAVLQLFGSTFFLWTTYRYLPFTNSLITNIYRRYVFGPIFSTAYFFSIILDIVILYDRVLVLMNKPKRKLSPYYTSFILLIFCALFTTPNLFLVDLDIITVQSNTPNGSLVHLYSIKRSNVINSVTGKVFFFTIFIIRDIVTVIVQIVANVICLVLLRRHLEKKNNMNKLAKLLETKKNRIPSLHVDETEMCLIVTLESYLAEVKKHDSIINEHLSLTRTHYSDINQNKQQDYRLINSRKELKATMMVLCLCTLTSLQNICNTLSFITYSIKINMIAYWLSFLAIFAVVFKHSLNLLVFYTFNLDFKRRCLMLLKTKYELKCICHLKCRREKKCG